MKLKVLIGCEMSGTFRRAFTELGAYAVSADILPAPDNSPDHLVCDVRDAIGFADWDMGLFRPTCTRLCRAGGHWLFGEGGSHPKRLPKGKTWDDMKAEFADGVDLFAACYNADIPRVAVENPRSHPHALRAIAAATQGGAPTQHVQPWWFGEPLFKETAWWLRNLPPLVKDGALTPPARGTDEWKRWNAVWLASPGSDRWAKRSQLGEGFARACAKRWMEHMLNDIPKTTFERVDEDAFLPARAAALAVMPPERALAVETPQPGDACYLSLDGGAGFVVRFRADGVEMGCVFSPGGGRLRTMLRKIGADWPGRDIHLNAFDPVAGLYAAQGFVEVDRAAFDWKYAPAGWPEGHEYPVVFLVRRAGHEARR